MGEKIKHFIDFTFKYYAEILLISILLFTSLAYGAVETWSITIVHVTVLLILTLKAIQAINKGQIKIYRTPLDIPILLFLILCFFSMFFSVYHYASRIMFYKVITYIVFFYFVINLFRTKKKLNILILVIVIFGSLYATFALIMISGNFLGFKIFSKGNYVISLTYVNRNHFAGFLEMIIWLCIGLALVSKGAKRVLFLCLAVYCAVAIFFSLSRGGILGLLGSLLFLSIIFTFYKYKRKNILILSSFLILVITVMIWMGIEPVLERLETLKNPSLTTGRLEYWKGTINLISEYPLFGSGLATFPYVFPRFQPQKVSNRFVNHAHNDYLEITSDLGIIGFLLIIFSIGIFFHFVIKRLYKQLDKNLQIIALCVLSGICSILIHAFVEFNFQIPSNVLLFATSSAIVIIVTQKTGRTVKKLNIPLSRAYKTPLFIALFLFLSISLIATISPVIGKVLVKKSKEHQEEKEYDLANNCLKKAIFIDSGNDQNYSEMGNLTIIRAIYEKDNEEKEILQNKALSYLDTAIKLCPVKSLYYTQKAYFLRILERFEEANEFFKNAAFYKPMNADTRYDLANSYLKLKQIEKACFEYNKLLRLNKQYLGKVYDELSEADVEYIKITETIPDNAEIRKKFAYYLFKKDKNEQALNELALAFEIEPTQIYALAQIKGICRTKNYDTAKQLCLNYLTRFSSDIPLRKQMALIYDKLEMFDEAKSIYKKLIQDNPVDGSLYILLSKIHGREKKYLKAVETLQEGLEFDTQNAAIFYYLGINYRNMDKIEDSFNAFKKATLLSPGNINYCFVLAKEYKRKGLFQDAFEQWKKCLEIKPNHKRSKIEIQKLKEELRISTIDSQIVKGKNI
ncbi:MAG: O-antigen ligase family protein [Candidatus Cloacimonetes bacterium]|nr:O-antigen ligase family protein [Candidatus Cloacimonadota bacterium]